MRRKTEQARMWREANRNRKRPKYTESEARDKALASRYKGSPEKEEGGKESRVLVRIKAHDDRPGNAGKGLNQLAKNWYGPIVEYHDI